jgi:hypothetical protein
LTNLLREPPITMLASMHNMKLVTEGRIAVFGVVLLYHLPKKEN